MIYLRADIENQKNGSVRYEYCMVNDDGTFEKEKAFPIEKFKIQENEVGRLRQMNYEDWEKESNGVGWVI